MTNQIEAYSAGKIGGPLNAPVFAVKHDGDVFVRFSVYLGNEPVCNMSLENNKWTARHPLTGRKISARKGAWFSAATTAIKKHIELNGGRGSDWYKELHTAYINERAPMVPKV